MLSNEFIFKIPPNVSSTNYVFNTLLSELNSVELAFAEKVIFDFSETTWFSGEMSSFLGSIFEYLSITHDLEFLNLENSNRQNTAVLNYLRKNGLLPIYFDQFNKTEDVFHTVMQYKMIKNSALLEKSGEIQMFNETRYYIENQIFSHKDWNTLFPTEEERENFQTIVYELVDNVISHSSSKMLILSGQFYPNKNKFKFSISDLGKTIPVAAMKRYQGKSHSDSINWSVQSGNTSREEEEYTRGLGLAETVSTLKSMGGELHIVSNRGMWILKEDGNIINSLDLKSPFPGTFIQISMTPSSQEYSDTPSPSIEDFEF